MYNQADIQPASVTGQPTQFVILPSSTGPTIDHAYNRRKSVIYGACLIVLGCLCFMWNVIQLCLPDSYGPQMLGSGIWCGIMIIITGSFGITAGRRKTRCKIIAFMVLCIVTSCMCFLPFTWSVIGAVKCAKFRSYYVFPNGVVALHSLMAATVALGAIMAICGSALGCKAVCCSGSSRPMEYGVPLMVIAQPGTGPQQFVRMAPPANASSSGVVQCNVLQTQPQPGIMQPMPPIQPHQRLTVTAPMESQELPAYGDMAAASRPMLPPVYQSAAYEADALPQKC